VWVIDRDAALDAIDALIAACDPAGLPWSVEVDVEVDTDALDPEDRARLDPLWPDPGQPIAQVWRQDAILCDTLARLREQCVDFTARLLRFRSEVEDAPERYEVLSADLHGDEPGLLQQTRQARDWVHNPRQWQVQDLERTLAAADRAHGRLARVVAAHSASERRVMESAIRLYKAVYPSAKAPVVVGLSRIETWGAVAGAAVLTFLAVLPMCMALSLWLS